MRILLVAMLVLFAGSALAEDMQKYLSETEDLARRGVNQQALERFIWFHEHALEHDPAMAGVRLSFALGSWKDLADKYPPALKAMTDIRDRDTNELMNGQGNFKLFHDVSSINETLGEEGKTLTLFQFLDQNKLKLAKECWTVAKDGVLAAKKYDLARKYIGDPMKELEKAKQMYDLNLKLEATHGAEFKQYNENHWVEESLQLIDYALGIKDVETAKKLQAQALAVLDDRRLRDAIPKEPEGPMAK